MGVLAQVGLLLWKNTKLKTRSPLLTVTTLLWPIIIFAVIAIIRDRIPPVRREECHFQPQALPSVGTVDFMQSMMCDIETRCESAEEVPKSNEPPTFGASVGLLLDDLGPLFEGESTIVDDIEMLSDTLDPLINLTHALEDVYNTINEQDLYIDDFFMNSAKLKSDLLKIFNGSEAEIELIEAMLGAKINVLELLDVIGYSDSTSLVCNASALQKYVIFPSNTNVEKIASSLCSLKRKDVENIINIVLQELDVHYIANEVTDFLRALDRYGLDNFTRDVLDIQEQLENITALSDFVDVLPQLLQLTQLIPDIQRFFEAIQDGDIERTLYGLRRIIATIDWEGAPPWWSDVQDILSRITDIVSVISNMVIDIQGVDFEDIFTDGKVMEIVKMFNISRDSISALLNATIQNDKISDFVVLLYNPDAYCQGMANLDDFFTVEGTIDEDALRNLLCKPHNGTSFLEALLGEFTDGKSIQEVLEGLQGVFQPVEVGLEIGSLINQTLQIFEGLEHLPDFIKELPFLIQGLGDHQLSPLINLISVFQNQSFENLPGVLIHALIEGSTVAESMFVQFDFWPIIQEQLVYQIVILDAQVAVIERVLDGALVDAFKDDPFTQVGELFLEFGPNITEAILSTFLDPAKIEELVSMSPEDQQLVLCSDFIEYPPGLDVSYAKEELCKVDVAELYPSHVEVWASYFPEAVHAINFINMQFTGNLSSIPPELLANATFRNLIFKQLELQQLLDSALKNDYDLDDFFAGLAEDVDVTGTADEWNAMLNRLVANSIPALSESVLLGEFESVLDSLEDIPGVHSFLAIQAIEDIIIQDLNIVFSIFNSLSRGEVLPYGGEIEKVLRGIVFLNQQGNAIQAAIVEAYQDPAKALALGSTTDITLILCNATLRDSLLDLTSVDVSLLDSSLCSVNYELLINDTITLMQIERLFYLFDYIKYSSTDPIGLNITEVGIHTNELVATMLQVGESWQNWIELVVNGSDWLSLTSQFTPQPWMQALNLNATFDITSLWNLNALLQDFNAMNITIMIEDLVTTLVPHSEVVLHKVATMEYAVLQALHGANNAFRLLQGVSEGVIIQDLQGTETAKAIEALLEVDLIKFSNALSDPEVIGVVSQVGYLPFFCNATIRDVILDLPGKGVDTSLFDRTICTIDWPRLIEELYVFLNVPQVEEWLSKYMNPSGELLKPSDIAWDKEVATLELFFRNLGNITVILQGLGEQLDIDKMLAYYETQWIADIIGVYPTNNTDFIDVLTEQLNMVWKQLDDSLAEVPGWDQYRTNVYIILSAIEQITTMNTTGVPSFTLGSIVPNVTELVVLLREIPNLSDDLIYQLLNAPIDPAMLIELASSNSWNETLCDADLLSGIFIEPAGLNMTQLQEVLCSIDFQAIIDQLSQGTGIEHLVSMIIDQIINFSGGDDFGIGDYDPAQWASRLEQLIKSYDLQNIQGFIDSLANEFLMIYEDIDSMLENVTGWNEFKADLSIFLTILNYTTPYLGNGTNGEEPISLSILVPNATELALFLAQNTPFSPEIISAIIYTPINPTKLIELAVLNNWNSTLCSEEGLRMLFIIPDGFNVTMLQGALCSVDFQNTLMELMANGAIENIISVIIDELYLSIIPELTIPGFDLELLTDLIPKIIATVRAGNVQNLPQYFESLNSLTAMFANETWYRDVVMQLQFADFLKKTFSDKIIVLEGRSITYPSLGNLLANSSEIQRILLDDYQVGLGLVEGMMSLALQPEKLISFFNMTNPFLTLCANGQFSDFFYSPYNPDQDVASLEEAICKVNPEQLILELKDLVSFDDLLEQIQYLDSSNRTVSYNWTSGYLAQEGLNQAIEHLIVNPPQLSFDEAWVNETLATLIGLADRLNRAQQMLYGGSPSDISNSFASLALMLEQGIMANQSWAIDMASSLRTINAVLEYTNTKLWALPGKNITLQDLLPPDIATAIEANSDLTPDIITMLLHGSVDTALLLVANETWLDAICSDAQYMSMYVTLPPEVDVEAARQAICLVNYDQWALAYMQEIQTILIEIESGKDVNFTSIIENFQKLAFGIQTILENPPTLLKYNEEWFQSIFQRTEYLLVTTLTSFNETRFLMSVGNLPMLINQVWNEIATSDPSLLIQARLNDYITQVLLDMLQMFQGGTYTLPRLDELFGDTLYVRELLSHSNIAPEIIDTFMTLVVDQQKLIYLINTPNVFVELCESGQFSTFFMLPPDSPTDITQVEEAFCTTNLTLVLAELDQKFKFSDIAIQIERIISGDPTLPPFNQTAASIRMMEFSNLIGALVMNPPNVAVDPIWWEDVYNRSEVIVNQWLQRLTEQALNGSSIPGLDMVLLQLEILNIPGFNVSMLEGWLQQVQLMEYINGVVADLLENNNGTDFAIPTFSELFPDPTILVDLLTDLQVSEEVIDAFLGLAVQADKWTQVWMNPDPLQAVCNSNLFQETFNQALNSSVDVGTIQMILCSLNLTSVDALLNDIFQANSMIVQISLLIYNDPNLDWQEAWNTSVRFNQMFNELFRNPPVTEEDIKQVALSLFAELESMLRMYDVWDNAEHFLKYVELYLQVVEHHLGLSINFTKDLFDPAVPLDRLVRYVGMTPDEIRTALLGDITDIFLLADLYYLEGNWNYLYYCDDKEKFESIYNTTNDGFLDLFAVREVFCSVNISEFFETAKNIYGIDFMRLTELGYIRSRNSSDPGLDIKSLVDLATDVVQMITDLISLPPLLTQDLDLDFFVIRLTNLSTALNEQDFEELIILLGELAPLLQSPDVVYQLQASLLSGRDIMTWFAALESTGPVPLLEQIEATLNETLLWHSILPALNFVDLLIQADVDALNPLGYRYFDLITNETALQQYLTDLLGLAPEYAQAITLSGIKDVFMLASQHLSGTWESTYCVTVVPANSTDFNLTAVYSLLCNLNRDQFFESLSSLMGIDVLELTQWIGDLASPGRLEKRFEWQTIVDNVQSYIDMLNDLVSIGEIGGVNVTQVEALIQKLQQGMVQFDYEVLIEQMEILNQILYLDGEWDDIKGYMNTVTNIVEWINQRLDTAHANNETLVELISHHAIAFQNLFSSLGNDLFFQLLTSNVNPEKAMALHTESDINTVVCDKDSFDELLQNSLLPDTNYLQGVLCYHVSEGHPTLANDLLTHFSIAPLEHEITVLATDNFENGFQDQDIDMRHMINEFEKLSNGLLAMTVNEMMGNTGLDIQMILDEMYPDDILTIISEVLTPVLPTLPGWNEVIYPILGRLDLAMMMADDLYLSLPERESEIQAVLDNDTIVNAAIPVILAELPNITLAWNEVMEYPLQIPVLSKMILELLKGSLEGISDDPTYLVELLTPQNTTSGPPTAIVDFIVSLDRILLTDFGQQLIDVFRIRENAERLDIITDFTNFANPELPPFDATFFNRTKEFWLRFSNCISTPEVCHIDLRAPATLDILLKLLEIPQQLPGGNLENLGDIYNILVPIVEDFLKQIENGTSEFENTLNLVFTFLNTVFESNKVPIHDVLSFFEFEEALFNSSSFYQFLRENTDLTEIDIGNLRNGSINVTVLFELFDVGLKDSIHLPCEADLLDGLFLNINNSLKDDILMGLCNNGTLVAVEFLRSNIDIGTIVDMISQNAGQTFPEFLLETLGAIGNLPEVDYEALGEFAAIVVPALFDDGFPTLSDLDTLAENINITIRALRSVDSILTLTEGLFEDFLIYGDVQRLVETLLDNIYVLELFVQIPDLTVNRILKDEGVLEDFLVANTALRKSEARDITYATFNLEELFLTEVSNILERLCDPDYLSNLLAFPNQTDVTAVTGTMCGLSGNEIALILDAALPFVDVSAVVNVSYLADNFDGAFSISNKTINDVMQSIESLGSISAVLPALQEALSGFDDDPALERLREMAQLGSFTGEEISAVTQEIVCGRTSLRTRRDADDTIRTFDNTPISSNRDGFCANIFSSIVNGIDGRLVWAYLKPIVEGSILYSPDIPPVRRIIEKANATFENIALTQRFADVWLTSGGDLQTALDPDTLTATMALLDNSYIQGLLEDQYSISTDQFTEVLNGNVTAMDPAQIQTLNLLAELVSNLTTCFNLNRFIGYANETAMVQAARNLDQDNTLLAAVAFDIPADATELPAHIKYKIRMDTDNTPPTDRLRDIFLTRSSANDFVFDLRYLRGYIMLQDMIEGSIVSLQASPDLQPPGVYLQMTPYPRYLDDRFASIFTLILPLVMTVSFVVLIGVMTHQLVYEKERGIEELLKVMGLPSGANWWAWFIFNTLLLFLLSSVVVIILKFAYILPMTDWSLLLVFFLDYFFSLIMFCYLASAVFYRASIASLASILIYLIFYLPYLAVFASESLFDALWKPVVTSIFFPSTFSIGCVIISQFENLGSGVQWDLVWHNPQEEEVTTMAFVFIALAVDGAIYFILGWYIKTLFPGKYGIPRKWYFPLQPSFWCQCSMSRKRDMKQYINSAFDPESGVALTDQGPVVEEEPSNLPVGIAILNLTKVYRSCLKDEKVAVDNLTLNFFEGQVTALLGHNGAGKTTTINIVTGLFPASSGKVYLHGINVAKKASAPRDNLGVCVQHNALYDNLTVREHMAMTGRIKGLTGKQLDDDIYSLMEDVGLLKKSEEQVRNLSGGMKRKLSVAMAFVGNSKIVILDEPTSGVDPHARRAIWNLIMKHKTGRTILLCTHFMDEADILGDRIAILDQGHLRCCGSPAFLKSRFSSGYRLSLAKAVTSGKGTPVTSAENDFKTGAVPNIYDTMKSANSDAPSSSSGIASDPGSSCDASHVTNFIQHRIPSANLQDDIGTELVYALPVDHGEREKFQELFKDLDSSLEELGIKSYGISDTTLKEVFLKVSTNRSVDGETEILKNNNWSLRHPGESFTTARGIARDKSYQPNGQFIEAVPHSAWGIFVKRVHFLRRDWQGLVWTVLMPVIMVALAIGLSQLNQIDREYQRQLTPAMFNPNSYVFFSDESEKDMGQRLTDALINPPGLGTTCMADADQKDLYPCQETNSHLIDQNYNYNLSSLAEVPEGRCREINTGFGLECDEDAGGIRPPTWVTDTFVYLQNISEKEDIDRYLVDTQLEFRNSRYILFGGVSWFDVMELNQTLTKAWYNNRAYHAMPTMLNVMNNIILRATVDSNSEEYGITAYNHPLELSKQDLGVDIWLDAAKTFGIVIVLVAALVLIPSAFSMFLVNENINGSKRLHYISGVGTLTYWLTNLIWDMLSFCLPIALMLLIFYIFDFRGLILVPNVGAFVALVFLYGFAIMTQIYIFIPFFKEAGSAFIFIFCLLLLEAVITNIPNWLVAVDVVSDSETHAFKILNYVLLVFSPYCLSSGILSLMQNQALADIYLAFGVDDGVFEDPYHILKWHYVALAAEGALAFLVVLLIDGFRNSSCSSCLDPDVDGQADCHDNEDVLAEKEKVLTGGSKGDVLVLQELRKVYRGPGKQRIVAVNDLYLGVSKGECFGLLGVNGAGKTSTFRMIVEDLSPTQGSIKKRAQSIGYCPQENAMYPQLTGEELLYCYARMKGINSSGIGTAINEVCEELGMERFLRRRISTYSGGMKRCLAVAVALLGKPELILMDEPTTGMDPITKQRVLTSIVNVVRDNRSVILTSHSMEECEAVCTRLAIMVNGQFCCLGSPQHVKNRHGNGYSLVVRGQKTAKTDMSLITEFVHRSFPGAELKEHHHNVVRFQLPPHNISVATIFGVMEREKSSLSLEDYSVSQTTLDEVFVNFAKRQTDGLEDETSSTTSAQEVSVINRAFEPDQDLQVDVFPKNNKSIGTQF
ncbi:uncharacterized protein LOC121431427 [Lytechinus variegatus]|uniref:uncharacterized protein LOC121431427 n=1 Tax=Lytechinus variegatus TaxID=7654 RepID=UPI001BB17F57|nr:uncharacterized protein LOC121431427 [Lytechinus variegatus]